MSESPEKIVLVMFVSIVVIFVVGSITYIESLKYQQQFCSQCAPTK